MTIDADLSGMNRMMDCTTSKKFADFIKENTKIDCTDLTDWEIVTRFAEDDQDLLNNIVLMIDDGNEF